jgi:UPF0271 protein
MGRLLQQVEGKNPLRFVLDTSALIGGVPLSDLHGELFTVEEVLEEARSTMSRSRLEAGLSSGLLKIASPSAGSLRRVKHACARTGNAISETDARLLALALDLGAVLLTDDYSLQNAAAILGVETKPIVTEGIREVRLWESFCPACGKAFSPERKRCPVCGSPLSRRVRRRHRL